MVETAKPISRSLYTDKRHRGKKESKSLPTLGFLLPQVINTVFTDEGMQFALRGQQKEPRERERLFGLVTERKDQSRGRLCSCVHETFTVFFWFYIDSESLKHFGACASTLKDDIPPSASDHGMMAIIQQRVQISKAALFSESVTLNANIVIIVVWPFAWFHRWNSVHVL